MALDAKNLSESERRILQTEVLSELLTPNIISGMIMACLLRKDTAPSEVVSHLRSVAQSWESKIEQLEKDLAEARNWAIDLCSVADFNEGWYQGVEVPDWLESELEDAEECSALRKKESDRLSREVERLRLRIKELDPDDMAEELAYLRDWKAGAEGARTISFPPRIGPHTEEAYVGHKGAYLEGPEAYREGADCVAEAVLNASKKHDRKLLEAYNEIDEWKDASGLMRGGDPGGVRPSDSAKYWQGIEARLAAVEARLNSDDRLDLLWDAGERIAALKSAAQQASVDEEYSFTRDKMVSMDDEDKTKMPPGFQWEAYGPPNPERGDLHTPIGRCRGDITETSAVRLAHDIVRPAVEAATARAEKAESQLAKVAERAAMLSRTYARIISGAEGSHIAKMASGDFELMAEIAQGDVLP